jgi:hypothetical protein
MCHTAINLISKALSDVDNAEVLLKIKGVIALFIQTMDVGCPPLTSVPILKGGLGMGVFCVGAGYLSTHSF